MCVEFDYPNGGQDLLCDNMPVEQPKGPCVSCPYARWIDMYGEMVYGCHMGYCTLADEEQ